jgi:hypothetical protein
VATIDWEWTREQATPDDVLDAAKTIPITNNRILMNLTCRWVEATRYLTWAGAALQRGGEDGWDSAAGWAKRAVCRQMDCILANNHLGNFLGKNYKDKAGYLTQLKVPGLAALRELVIDPRNEIEHAYELATEEQARRAYDVAELFLGATQQESDTLAVVALGWSVDFAEARSTAPGKEGHWIDLRLSKGNGPMLLILGYPDNPETVIVLPGEETLRSCPLRAFSSDQAIALNGKLRKCLKPGSYSSRTIDKTFLRALKEQLKIEGGGDG